MAPHLYARSTSELARELLITHDWLSGESVVCPYPLQNFKTITRSEIQIQNDDIGPENINEATGPSERLYAFPGGCDPIQPRSRRPFPQRKFKQLCRFSIVVDQKNVESLWCHPGISLHNVRIHVS